MTKARRQITIVSVRWILGLTIAGLLGYSWLQETSGFRTVLLKMIATGTLAGCIIGSPWALLGVPVALFNGGWLWRTIACSYCEALTASRSAPIAPNVALYGALAGSAAVSAIITKALLHKLSSLASARRNG